MRIVVVDVPADRGGALSVLQDFYQYVKEYGQQDEWIFMVSTPEFEACKHIRVERMPWIRKGLLHRIYWDYARAARKIEGYQADVVFSLQNVPVPFVKLPQLVYVHQSLPFQQVKQYSFFRREERSMAFYQHIIGSRIIAGVSRASKVIVQSTWMKQSMLHKARIEDERVVVVPPAFSMPAIRQHILQEGNPIRMNRFFYPAGASHYKNHQCILKAVELLLHKGIQDFTVEFTIRQDDNGLSRELYNDALGLGDRVKFNGQLPRDEVYQKLTESVLLFPSYIETVGLPLVEARHIGSVILASDCNFSHENLLEYDNARFFDPMDPSSLAQEMELVISGGWNYTAELKRPSSLNSGWRPVVNMIKECVNT